MNKDDSKNKAAVELSNTEKIFFPESGISKGDLIQYYKKISKRILPLIKDRPLTMVRYPNGIKGRKFFQKDKPDYFPQWIRSKEIKKQEGGTTDYILCNDEPTLTYLANQACITPHIWLSRQDQLHKPDRMIIDLDPEDQDFSKVRRAAVKVKELFQDRLELPCYFMTTGSRGIHVIIPMQREHDFDKVRTFCQKCVSVLERENPEDLTTAIRKNKRQGKLFLDVARNAFGQTAVAPYAIRPYENAPVATPLAFEELSDNTLSARKYHMKNIFRRLARKDPWQSMENQPPSINKALVRLKEMTSPDQPNQKQEA